MNFRRTAAGSLLAVAALVVWQLAAAGPAGALSAEEGAAGTGAAQAQAHGAQAGEAAEPYTQAPASESRAGSESSLLSIPAPSTEGAVSVEKAIAERRSVRRFADEKLTDQQLAQLLWSAQGITEERRGFRAAPSAGALYPLELYVATPEGVYKYAPGEHAVRPVKSGDFRRELAAAALGQSSVAQAPASFVITAVYERTAGKYGDRAERYVHIEVGCAAENLMLQAVALDLASVPVGAFRDAEVRGVIGAPAAEAPLLIIPVGKPAG